MGVNQNLPRQSNQGYKNLNTVLSGNNYYTKLVDTDQKDIQSKILQEEAESRAKNGLAEGFQLQDSVKISSQWGQDCDPVMRAEDSVALAQSHISQGNLVRQEQHFVGGQSAGGGTSKFQRRFMNDIGRTTQAYQLEQS